MKTRRHSPPPVIRSRGGQSGNQNGRRHGYYSRVLDEQERAILARLPPTAGLDAQIQLLQVKAASVRRLDPLNTRVFNVAVARIAKLLEAKELIDRLEKDAVYRKSVRDAFLEEGISLNFGPFATPDVTPATPEKK